MKRPFQHHGETLNSPLAHGFAVIPDDVNPLPVTTRAVHLGGGGDLKVTFESGDEVTLQNLGPGWHPLRLSKVWQTGTTAAAIVGGW